MTSAVCQALRCFGDWWLGVGVSLVVERTACVRADSQHKFVDSIKNFSSSACKYAIIFSFVGQIHKFGQDWWNEGLKNNSNFRKTGSLQHYKPLFKLSSWSTSLSAGWRKSSSRHSRDRATVRL